MTDIERRIATRHVRVRSFSIPPEFLRNSPMMVHTRFIFKYRYYVADLDRCSSVMRLPLMIRDRIFSPGLMNVQAESSRRRARESSRCSTRRSTARRLNHFRKWPPRCITLGDRAGSGPEIGRPAVGKTTRFHTWRIFAT